MPYVTAAKKKPQMKPVAPIVAPTKGVARPVGPPKGVDRPGAFTPTPPPPPPAPVFGAAPPTAQGQAVRSDADKAMSGANSGFLDSTYRAVMGLGDPTLIDKFKANPEFAGYNFVVDPTSTFSQLADSEKHGLQDINDSSLRSNTFFSGLRLNNRDDLSNNFLNQRAVASRSTQDAIAEYARALAAAQLARNSAYTDANTVDFNAANAVEPEPAAAPPPPVAAPTPAGNVQAYLHKQQQQEQTKRAQKAEAQAKKKAKKK